MHGPEPVLLLLLPRRREVLEALDGRHVAGLLLRELVHLLAALGQHGLGQGARIAGEGLVQGPKDTALRAGPGDLAGLGLDALVQQGEGVLVVRLQLVLQRVLVRLRVLVHVLLEVCMGRDVGCSIRDRP